MTRGEKVLALRREKGKEWTQQKLADEMKKAGADVSRAWVANVETDRAKNLFPAELRALSKVFGKPAEYFKDDSSVGFGHAARHGGPGLELRDAPPGFDTRSMMDVSDFPSVPVLGVVSADRFAFSFETFPEYHLPIPMERGRKLFALKISGDCMEPTFRAGEYVILSESQLPVDGKVVLAQLDNEFTLKRYFKRSDGIELKPDNAKYKPIKVASSKLVIRGVVVGTYRKDI